VCEAGNALSSECGSCPARVCETDPYCCGFEWDNLCIGRVEEACDNPGCIAPGSCSHALCVEGGALRPECDPGGCVQAICATHEPCCTSLWDATCVSLVKAACGGDCSFE
jgi:hypothetical protein